MFVCVGSHFELVFHAALQVKLTVNIKNLQSAFWVVQILPLSLGNGVNCGSLDVTMGAN